LAESTRFATDGQFITADVDLDRLRQERTRLTSFNDCVRVHNRLIEMRRIEVPLEVPTGAILLRREIQRYPFVPCDAAVLDERCEEAYAIQVQGLARRLEAVANKVVIGLSGGLDSTQALLVAAKTMDKLGLPRSNILAYSLPGFATTEHTRANASRLMQYLGVSAGEIDIRPSAMQMLRDIGHPYARGEAVFDITFENVQAGERASHLFRLANLHAALVVGTSDLSELALGYTTYGVGDQMSHYAVNASVPKTLIRHLVGWIARSGQVDCNVRETLEDILRSQITPELIPASEGKTVSAEDTVGPYELQDFNLYYLSRFGFRPSKVAYLAYYAWSQRGRGTWPSSIPEMDRREYDLVAIKRWLGVFIQRFFQSSQFKRSALPNGPKVGSGGSLSPRGDWRAPSDATADAWLKELRSGVPERGT
jgi:NAD+ synthase (glutamine-hydrolysing)